MPDVQTLDCLQNGLTKLERVASFNRMLLTAEDMRTDQDFVLQKLRRHNRFLHGWGVVCGLIAKASPTPTQPWRVEVGEGYALGPFGDEIFVGQSVFMDLKNCGPGAVTNPCEPNMMGDTARATGSTIYLGIKYAECRARPVLAMPAGCGCEEDACEYSRIRDSFAIECLADLPASHLPTPNQATLCDIVSGKALLTCPVCPTEPHVVLARVTLPVSPTAQMSDAAIDNKPPVRRIIFSAAMLQEQIIKCCCDRPSYPPARREADISVRQFFVEIESPVVRTRAFRYFIVVRNESATTTAKDLVVRDEMKGVEFDINEFATAFHFMNFVAEPPPVWTETDPFEFVARIDAVAPGVTVQLSFEVLIVSFMFNRGIGALENIVKVETLGTTDPNPGNNEASTQLSFRH